MSRQEITKLLNTGYPSQHIEKKGGYSYVSHPFLIYNMNKHFGHDGWDIQIIQQPTIIHQEAEDKGGRKKWHVIATASVRVTVRSFTGATGEWSTTIKEDVGTCSCQGSNLADVINTAFCGAPTQAVKRACHWLGNQFGASLYDGDNPVHTGGPDKWADLHMPREEIDHIMKSFQVELNKVKTKAAYQKLMSSYVNDLTRLPEADKKNLRTIAVQAQEKLNKKESENVSK
jgi:recombination DNA repair RAD52 pathway protein